MKLIEGNLIHLAAAGHFDLIVHGCNCFCTMGAGVAKDVREAYPQAYEADCATLKGDRSKLGTFTYAEILIGEKRLIVVNAYTQYDFKGPGVKADYDAIWQVFGEIRDTFPGRRIGYPRIGAGLARGDWEVISGIIDQQFAGEDHTLVVYQQGVLQA